MTLTNILKNMHREYLCIHENWAIQVHGTIVPLNWKLEEFIIFRLLAPVLWMDKLMCSHQQSSDVVYFSAIQQTCAAIRKQKIGFVLTTSSETSLFRDLLLFCAIPVTLSPKTFLD
jgi:hypothetical protein